MAYLYSLCFDLISCSFFCLFMLSLFIKAPSVMIISFITFIIICKKSPSAGLSFWFCSNFNEHQIKSVIYFLLLYWQFILFMSCLLKVHVFIVILAYSYAIVMNILHKEEELLIKEWTRKPFTTVWFVWILETIVCTHGLCWAVGHIWIVFYFHTSLLCSAASTLRAWARTCSDSAHCSIPFSSMNYRQRACSLQPQQPASQTQHKLTALALFWKHALNIAIKLSRRLSRHFDWSSLASIF